MLLSILTELLHVLDSVVQLITLLWASIGGVPIKTGWSSKQADYIRNNVVVVQHTGCLK